MFQKSDVTMIITLAAVISIVSCAHSEKHEEQEVAAKQPISMKPAPDAGASIETKQVAAEANAPFVTEVAFKKGSSELSREMVKRLDKIYTQAIRVGEIGEIMSFAWSDQEYPSEGALPEPARELADRRNAAVEAALRKLGAASLDRITMTEKPSGLKKSLNLGDTRNKAMFAQAGIRTDDGSSNAFGSNTAPNTDAGSSGKNKTASPKAGKAVVMIKLKR